MTTASSYAAPSAKAPLEFYQFERREPGDHDIQIEILFCGVCHSDVHTVRDEWGKSNYPLVPGHEIVGKIVKVGSQVKDFKVGDLAGVGCMVDSCRSCPSCQEGLEQYFEKGFTGTYGAKSRKGDGMTQGGYSNVIVVDQAFVLHISDKLPLEGVAPLLCAGITTYSPLRHWKIGKGHTVGVVGLGGLGHMAVKLAHSFGAKVTVFTTSDSKKAEAHRLGADEVVISKDPNAMKAQAGKFDFILNTVAAPHDLNPFLTALKRDGTMTLVGVPDRPTPVNAFALIYGNKTLSGSMIGGFAETQEMLDFCGEHGITADVEVIAVQQINEAYERMLNGDVKYRFSIDMASLKS